MYTLLQGFLLLVWTKPNQIQVSMPCIICFLTPILNKIFTTGSRTAEAAPDQPSVKWSSWLKWSQPGRAVLQNLASQKGTGDMEVEYAGATAHNILLKHPSQYLFNQQAVHSLSTAYGASNWQLGSWHTHAQILSMFHVCIWLLEQATGQLRFAQSYPVRASSTLSASKLYWKHAAPADEYAPWTGFCDIVLFLSYYTPWQWQHVSLCKLYRGHGPWVLAAILPLLKQDTDQWQLLLCDMQTSSLIMIRNVWLVTLC
jgi:hypothetical protein